MVWKMNEYTITYRLKYLTIENHESELSNIIEKMGVEVITGNKKYSFSVKYDGTIDQFGEAIKAEGFDLEKINLAPRTFVTVGDLFNPF